MTEPSSPPGKRSRTDTNQHQSRDWKHHPELYMPDGTMLFLADNTLFRVYPGLLSKHSEVFSGMASLSQCQPPNSETYDGCPVVRLTDDAEDLAFFFSATMGLQSFHHHQPTSFQFAAAILRLATKYMVEPLRRQAIEHFSRIIPTKFDEIGNKECYKKVFGDDPPHPFALVSLFRECQIPYFLPWAFYLACNQGFEKLVDGASHNDKPIHLSEADRRIALFGWKRLRDSTLRIRRTTVMSRATHCKQGACNDSLRMCWLDTAFYAVRSDAMEQWKLFNLLARYGETTVGSPLPNLREITPCSSCVASWSTREKKGREDIWNTLPQTFGLPNWEELRQEHARSIATT
ncbi:hypothetical protein JB92DRAFT_2810425 [Gautieria morchelliformis]|nr:hypothetical protein JB92DRAFT_2810425 [Gautieria morchelliformis]